MQTAVSPIVGQLLIPSDSRPPAFCERYLAIQPIPYHLSDSSRRSSPDGGVLCTGQAVWLEHTIQRTKLPGAVRAFVSDLGLVSLDPRWLKRGDGSLPQVMVGK